MVCEICVRIEKYFSGQNLVFILVAFLTCLVSTFRILEVSSEPYYAAHNIPRREFVILWIIQLLMSVTFIYNIVHSSSIVVEENKRCSINVHKLLNALTNDDVRSKQTLMQFSNQQLHHRVRFTACGLFTLDYALLFTVSRTSCPFKGVTFSALAIVFQFIGSGTTYLIILLQFSDHTENR